MGLTKGVINELENFAVFEGFVHDDIQCACKSGQVIVHEHREIVFRSGEPATHFGIVLSGAYKLSKIGFNGEESILHFSTLGDILAGLIMTQSQPKYPVTAQAMGPSRLLCIPRETYLAAWISNPALSGRIQVLMSTRLTRLHDLKAVGRAPVAAKIAALLVQLMIEAKPGVQAEIPLPITRKDIADSIGTTVETVIRTMSAWEKNGVLSTEAHEIKIHNVQELVKAAQGEL